MRPPKLKSARFAYLGSGLKLGTLGPVIVRHSAPGHRGCRLPIDPGCRSWIRGKGLVAQKVLNTVTALAREWSIHTGSQDAHMHVILGIRKMFRNQSPLQALLYHGTLSWSIDEELHVCDVKDEGSYFRAEVCSGR